jgi:DNA polymerase III subunit delta'
MATRHDALRATFERIFREGELHHAYLFFGDAHIGKAYFAKRFARFIEQGSDSHEERPLGDTMVVTPTEKGSIGIDEMRDVKSFLWQTPLASKKRIVIIDNAEALTKEAQGALLKIVEEPPTHALIIFVAVDPQMISAPLASRVNKIYFPRLSSHELAETLVASEHISESRAQEIARSAFGSIGRARRMLAPHGEESAPTLQDDIESRIIALREKGVVNNSVLIRELLMREVLCAQFNVNPTVQKKAVEYIASRSYNK